MAFVKQLLANPSQNLGTEVTEALQSAIHKGYVAVVKLLLEDHRIDVDTSETLIGACKYQQIEIVELLLADPCFNFDPSDNQNEALNHACE